MSGHISRKLLDKGECQKGHARKRFRERTGQELTEELYVEILSAITHKRRRTKLIKNIEFLRKESIRVSHFLLKLEGIDPLEVVYDRERRSIVTFLCPEEGSCIQFYWDRFMNKVNCNKTFGSSLVMKDGNKLCVNKTTDVAEIIGDNAWYFPVQRISLELVRGELYEV